MKAILKRLRKLSDQELLDINEAIEAELTGRLERVEEVPESARRRALQRERSYRRRTGAAAPPVVTTGKPNKHRKRRRAA